MPLLSHHSQPSSLSHQSTTSQRTILSSPFPNPRRVLMAEQAPTSSRPLKLQRWPLNSISSATPGPQDQLFSVNRNFHFSLEGNAQAMP
ncbi:hypothetical protein ACB092_06G138100 [Castanea dentata]